MARSPALVGSPYLIYWALPCATLPLERRLAGPYLTMR